MYVVGNVYISDDLADHYFYCDLAKCKGACCEQGDSGAPLAPEETQIIEEIIEDIKPYLTEEGRETIRQQGLYVTDSEGDLATPTAGGKECVYAYKNEQGVWQCAFETAWLKGKTHFQKPISCHLYPVRVTRLAVEEALNYHRWEICKPACSLGGATQMPLYRFLKQALVRKYGLEWYEELDKQVKERIGEAKQPDFPV